MKNRIKHKQNRNENHHRFQRRFLSTANSRRVTWLAQEEKWKKFNTQRLKTAGKHKEGGKKERGVKSVGKKKIKWGNWKVWWGIWYFQWGLMKLIRRKEKLGLWWIKKNTRWNRDDEEEKYKREEDGWEEDGDFKVEKKRREN